MGVVSRRLLEALTGAAPNTKLLTLDDCGGVEAGALGCLPWSARKMWGMKVSHSLPNVSIGGGGFVGGGDSLKRLILMRCSVWSPQAQLELLLCRTHLISPCWQQSLGRLPHHVKCHCTGLGMTKGALSPCCASAQLPSAFQAVLVMAAALQGGVTLGDICALLELCAHKRMLVVVGRPSQCSQAEVEEARQQVVAQGYPVGHLQHLQGSQ